MSVIVLTLQAATPPDDPGLVPAVDDGVAVFDAPTGSRRTRRLRLR